MTSAPEAAAPGILLAITAFLVEAGVLTAVRQTIAWGVVFFFASAGASSAYLTVSEIFPLEVRATAIAVTARTRPGCSTGTCSAPA